MEHWNWYRIWNSQKSTSAREMLFLLICRQKKANISSRVDNSEVSADSYSEVKEAKPGSMMSKANMVRDYNEKNSRK